MRKAILKQNDFQIETEVSKLEAIRKKFEPFHNALKGTGFDFSIKDFQQLAYGTADTLETWLKEKTLAATPEISSMKITHEAKLSMIAIADYSFVYQTHAAVTGKREVFSLDIQDGNLVISEMAKQQIIDKYTTFGNDDAVNVLKTLEGIRDAVIQFKQQYGFNPLTLIHVNMLGEISVNVEGINAALEKNKVLQA